MKVNATSQGESEVSQAGSGSSLAWMKGPLEGIMVKKGLR